MIYTILEVFFAYSLIGKRADIQQKIRPRKILFWNQSPDPQPQVDPQPQYNGTFSYPIRSIPWKPLSLSYLLDHTHTRTHTHFLVSFTICIKCNHI